MLLPPNQLMHFSISLLPQKQAPPSEYNLMDLYEGNAQ